MNKHKLEIQKNNLSWEKTSVKKCDKVDCNEKGNLKLLSLEFY